jgi:hypothetical protein
MPKLFGITKGYLERSSIHRYLIVTQRAMNRDVKRASIDQKRIAALIQNDSVHLQLSVGQAYHVTFG